MYCSRILKTVPDLLELHHYKPDDYPYLLASNTEGEVNTRYSILMAFPQQTYIQGAGDADCLDQIQIDLHSQHSDLPFVGGWFVFLSYEYAETIEPSVHYFSDQSTLPVAFCSKIPAAVIIDHQLNQSHIVALKEYSHLLDQILVDIDSSPKLSTNESIPDHELVEEDPSIYQNYLRKTHQYILDGDIFQANLSRLWEVKFNQMCDPVRLYKSLTRANPAPFASLIKINDHFIISSSPERLVSVNNGVVETRPIAGTHPRGKTQDEDNELAQMMLNHPKEKAEHVMLIDLERNDLGRICEPGSIKVKDKMVLETYRHVHHIVSSVIGKLRNKMNTKDVIHAVFPGGTITGCPKVRCMQIISELEQSPRGAYTGSLGYISADGQLDFNILIRTMTMHGSTVQFRAGAGIVYDSDTEKELNETRHKAKGLLNAFQSSH